MARTTRPPLPSQKSKPKAKATAAKKKPTTKPHGSIKSDITIASGKAGGFVHGTPNFTV